MKKCQCDKWIKNVGGYFQNPGPPFFSNRANIPLYFGVEIEFCPWCGQKLVKEEDHAKM